MFMNGISHVISHKRTGPPTGPVRPGLTPRTFHRAPVGQGPPGPGWLAISLGVWSGRALATGTAWAGLCLIHHHHPPRDQFLAPGFLARRRLARVIHHHHHQELATNPPTRWLGPVAPCAPRLEPSRSCPAACLQHRHHDCLKGRVVVSPASQHSSPRAAPPALIARGAWRPLFHHRLSAFASFSASARKGIQCGDQ